MLVLNFTKISDRNEHARAAYLLNVRYDKSIMDCIMNKDESLQRAEEVLKVEAESILGLIPRLDERFTKAVETIHAAKGRVIVSGIGKSGLIGKKIVATLTSTGTPALFLHPVEGMHGDLGIVTREDVVLAISNSGETNELNLLISNLRSLGAPLVAMTGNLKSTLALSADIVLDIGVTREACPFNLTPTSSTTATLAMGDALAVALIDRRGFKQHDFYRFHPGGTLGLRLMTKVRDAMISGESVPRILSGQPALDAVDEIDRKNLGFVLITDASGILRGILTDGDVRRYVRKGADFKNLKVDDIMTRSPKTIDENRSLGETIETMEQYEITAMVVVNAENKLQGYVHLHDILGRGGTLKISLNGHTGK